MELVPLDFFLILVRFRLVFNRQSFGMLRFLLIASLVSGAFSANSSQTAVKVKRSNEDHCGLSLEATGYVFGGDEVKRGEFPW